MKRGYRLTGMPDTLSLYGAWDELRIMREARGLTLDALARAAGLARSYLSRLEAGSRPPVPYVVNRLAEALDIPATMLGAQQFSPSEGT